jgi:hypothetical protein
MGITIADINPDGVGNLGGRRKGQPPNIAGAVNPGEVKQELGMVLSPLFQKDAGLPAVRTADQGTNVDVREA